MFICSWVYCYEYKILKGVCLIFNVGFLFFLEICLWLFRVELFEKIGLNDVVIWFVENRIFWKGWGLIVKLIFFFLKLI